MSERHPNEKVEIAVLPDQAEKRLSATERRKIKRLVRDRLLLPSKEPYHKVQVQVIRRRDGTPESLVVFMLRAYTYTADVVTVHIDADFNPTSIEHPSAGP